jgi:4-hydroxyproline epimerase
VWRQESIIGSSFEGRVEVHADGTIIPHVSGEAFITADAKLILDPRDPFRDGIRL